MATQLSQVLTFTAVAAGAQQTQVHSINVNGLALLPDLLLPDNDNFAFVSATTTSITVVNNGSAPATLHLWCWLQHSIDRAYGPASVLHLNPRPLWVGGGVSGGGGTSVIIEDEGTPLAGAPHTTLNFAGAGVIATDAGAGVALITVPGGGGGSDTSASTVLTFRPGSGLTGPSVYTDWTTLYGMLNALRSAASNSGDFTIVMDNADAAIVIPAGAWDMNRTAWVGVRGFDSSTPLLLATLTDGAAITNLLSITGCLVRPAATNTTSAITLADGQTLNLYGAQLAPAATSAHTVLFVTGHAYLRLSDECSIAPTDGGKVIQLDVAATLDVHLDGERAQLIGGTIIGDNTTALNVFIGSGSAVFGWPQTFMTGTVLYVQQGATWGVASSGSPTGILTAAHGAIFTDFSTGLQYQNTDGATTWSLLTTPAVIFDNSITTLHTNIRSARLTNQSPIDNTKAQITNLGSQDHLQNAGATGATAKGATIGGGDDNTASAQYATVAGGAGNSATTNSATVGGGTLNAAAGFFATIGGGSGNATTVNNYPTIGGGLNNACSGQAGTVAGGSGNVVSNTNATVSGGASNHATAVGATVCGGISNTASGLHSHAEGNSNTASGEASHVEGDSCTASGDFSHAEGNSTIASNFFAHAEGFDSEANGQSSHAEGEGSFAQGRASHAQGWGSQALRSTQDAYGISAFSITHGPVTGGVAQTSVLIMTGFTPGVATGETCELLFGIPVTSQLILEDGKGYAFKIVASAIGIFQGGAATLGSRSIEISFNARRDAGVTTITGTGPANDYGSGSSVNWSLAATVGVGPDRIVLTFATGASITPWRTHITARVEFTETYFENS